MVERQQHDVGRDGGGQAGPTCAPDEAPEFVQVDGLPDAVAAEKRAVRLAVEMLETDPVLGELGASRLRVLERSRIPPKTSDDPSPFVALHFDWGQPLFPTKSETLYLFLALFMPADQRASAAETRVVSIESLMSQRSWGTGHDVEMRLRGYAASHGSSWDWDGDSGGRVSCYARIIDALEREHVLTNFRHLQREEWYERSKAANEFESLGEERAFYAQRGVELNGIEHSVVVKPGELLLINNVRAVHGRTGKREPEELHQFLIGIPGVRPQEASVVRQWLVATSGCP